MLIVHGSWLLIGIRCLLVVGRGCFFLALIGSTLFCLVSIVCACVSLGLLARPWVSWLFFVVIRCSWSFLVVLGCSLMFLVVVSCPWLLLVVGVCC